MKAIRLKNKPRMCPLCRGKGVSNVPIILNNPPQYPAMTSIEEMCKLCRGAKMVRLEPYWQSNFKH